VKRASQDFLCLKNSATSSAMTLQAQNIP